MVNGLNGCNGYNPFHPLAPLLLPVGVPQTDRNPYGWASVHGWQALPTGNKRRVPAGSRKEHPTVAG